MIPLRPDKGRTKEIHYIFQPRRLNHNLPGSVANVDVKVIRRGMLLEG